MNKAKPKGNATMAAELLNDKFFGRLLYGATGVLLLVIFAAVGVMSNITPESHAEVSDSYATTATVRVASSCSMSANPFSTDIDHTATLINGQARTDGIGLTTIKTTCNDLGGYSIYAVGYSGNIYGANELVSSSVDGTDIPTGTTLDGTVSNWAMKIGTPTVSHDTTYDPIIESTYSSWAAVPSIYQKVASYDSGVVPSNSGSYITTTYAAAISPTQTAGTYVGKVKYTLVHPGISEITTDHDMQQVANWSGELLVGDSIVATDNRDGKTYSVARLCMNRNGCDTSTPDYKNSMLWMTQNLDLKLSPSTTLNSGNTNLTAYQDENGNTFAGYTYNNGVVYWTPGSTLANPATISDFAYSSSATSVVSGWSNQASTPYQAEGSVDGNPNDEVYIVTSDNNNRDTIYTSLPDCKAGVINSGKASTQAQAEAYCKHYHVGNYYNYTASIAMNDSSSIANWHEVAPNSICPAGWRLPIGLQNNTNPNLAANVASEYNQMLYANYITDQLLLTDGQDAAGPNTNYASNGFLNIRKSPIWLVRSGDVNATTLYYSSYGGFSWSSTAVPGSLAYYLDYDSGGLYPARRGGRGLGLSLRCVEEQPPKNSIDDLKYMQDFRGLSETELARVKSSMTMGANYTLIDNRDGNEYIISKLADGKIWMRDNLRLDPTDSATAAKMSSANTNASAEAITNYKEGGNPGSVAGWSSQAVTKNWTENSYTNPIVVPGYKDDMASSRYGEGNGRIGVYYNYCAATVGTYCYAGGTTGTGNASQDICPAGWRMPTGGGTNESLVGAGEYQTLCSTINGSPCASPQSMVASDSASLQDKLSTPLSGDFYDSAQHLNGAGYWWSSTFYNGYSMYNLFTNAEKAGPLNGNHRYYGFSMRCVMGS